MTVLLLITTGLVAYVLRLAFQHGVQYLYDFFATCMELSSLGFYRYMTVLLPITTGLVAFVLLLAFQLGVHYLYMILATYM